jgi:hypothetical protein
MPKKNRSNPKIAFAYQAVGWAARSIGLTWKTK